MSEQRLVPGDEHQEPEERGPLPGALVGLALVLAVGRLAGAAATEVVAGVVLLVVPLAALALPGRNRTLFLLAGAAGSWALEGTAAGGGVASLPLLIVRRVGYFAVPPLLLALALAPRDRRRLGLGPAHLYAPAVVMGMGGLVHLAFNWKAQVPGPEVRIAAAFYGGCYALLIGVALIMRLRRAGAPQTKPVTVSPGVELEEQGRFGLAARAYEREGDPRKAAEMAARAGDWARAARLYRLVEADFDAGEMYYRAGMLPEALRSYESAGDLAAAARLSLELGKVDEAVAFHEQAADWAGVVGALEASGRRPTIEQYRKAGLFRKAAETLEEAGQWLRAGEMYEHDLGDVERAIAAYLKGDAGLEAGRLLETQGRREEALRAFATVPAGAADAARLHLDAGRPNDAAAVFAQVPTAEIEKLDDDKTLARVAAFLVDSGRNLEAVRLLQVVKRRGPTGGKTHLLLGRALHARQLTDLAEQELRSALGMPLEPADRQQAEYRLACLLEEAGRGPEALPLFHAILERELSYADAQERYRRLKAALTAETAEA